MLVIRAFRAAVISADWSRSILQDTYNSCLIVKDPISVTVFQNVQASDKSLAYIA